MNPRKCLPVVLSALCVAALAAAPIASAATVETGRACYVAHGTNGVNVDVTGSGFNPGEEVFAEVPAPGGLGAVDDTTIAPDGALNVTVTDLFPEAIEPNVEK